jgi:hypothetical protein
MRSPSLFWRRCSLRQRCICGREARERLAGKTYVGGNSVNAVLLGQAIPFATPGKDDVWGGYGGLGIEFRHANVAVLASGEYLALNDDSSWSAARAACASRSEARAAEPNLYT